MLSSLLAELSRADAYPHEVEKIRVAQTHISCVFLTGRFAYKIKKPVKFAFVDYSTLEKRHEMCLKEVELNRRLCPSVYLDVIPITQQNHRIRINGSGKAIEWAVRMKQLPESEMLSERLGNHNVSETTIKQIANTIVDFHLHASSGYQISQYGTSKMISRNVEENFQETDSTNNEILPASELRTIEKFSRDFLRDHESLFQERIKSNWIRDGHGDLRIQNICLAADVDRGVQIFDCIEFNERLRCVDVLADVAYLAMDLDLAGRSDLRHFLLKEYLRKIEPGAELLRFYSCYRAYVRGKIALFAAAEAEVPEEERQLHSATGAAAFDLAACYAALPNTPPIMCMLVGFSGSGKSSLARELSRRLPAVLISSDVVRKRLANVPQNQRLGNEWYSPHKIAEVYELMRKAARNWIQSGENVILDATFLSAEERMKTAHAAAESKARFWIIECESPDWLIRKRLQSRARDASDADISIYESQLHYKQPMIERETLDVAEKRVQVLTERNPATLVREILISL